MRQLLRYTILGLGLAVTGCVTDDMANVIDPPVDTVLHHPDHSIVVAPATPGSQTMRAFPPDCPSWSEHTPDQLDNMPQPQLGCANQRNLALTVDNPADLLQGGRLGPADATRNAANIQRYENDKTRGLYDPNQPPAAKE